MAWMRAFRSLDVTGIAIAHVRKDGANPAEAEKYPFGSIFWHNSARCTWFVKDARPDDTWRPRARRVQQVAGGDHALRSALSTCRLKSAAEARRIACRRVGAARGAALTPHLFFLLSTRFPRMAWAWLRIMLPAYVRLTVAILCYGWPTPGGTHGDC